MRALLHCINSVPITTAGLSLIDIVDMIALCCWLFFRLEKNLPLAFPVNSGISLFCGPSTWKLWVGEWMDGQMDGWINEWMDLDTLMDG